MIVSVLGLYFLKDSLLRETRSSIRTFPVQKMDLVQQVTIAGNVMPERKTIVTAPFSGYVKTLHVKVGDEVEKGDPLVSVVSSLQSTDPVFPLRSPFDGTVVEVPKEVGEFVTKDDTKDYLLRVDSLRSLYIFSHVPEVDRTKIRKGLEVIIRASAILDKTYKGRVEEVALASRQQERLSFVGSSVEFRTKIKILDFDEDLKPGMSAILDIVTHKKEDVLAVPHEFIFKDSGQYYAFLKDGERVEVQVGLQNEFHFEITGGVKEGQVLRQVDFVKMLENNL